jgi:hypothetical protein
MPLVGTHQAHDQGFLIDGTSYARATGNVLVDNNTQCATYDMSSGAMSLLGALALLCMKFGRFEVLGPLTAFWTLNQTSSHQ